MVVEGIKDSGSVQGLLSPKFLLSHCQFCPILLSKVTQKARFSGWGIRCHLVGRAAKSSARLGQGKNLGYFNKHTPHMPLRIGSAQGRLGGSVS